MSHTDPQSAGHGPLQNPEVAHEESDVNVRALAGFVVALFVVAAIVHVLMWGLLVWFQKEAAENDPIVSPLARPAADMPSSLVNNPFFGPTEGPQLLTNEPSVLQKHRQTEADALGTYGWVDEKTRVARIPIGEAKKLIVQRGLPARADGAADTALGTRRGAYGESSGGRAITSPPAPREQESAPQEAPAPGTAPKGSTGH